MEDRKSVIYFTTVMSSWLTTLLIIFMVHSILVDNLPFAILFIVLAYMATHPIQVFVEDFAIDLVELIASSFLGIVLAGITYNKLGMYILEMIGILK